MQRSSSTRWWPPELGHPAATGSQNSMRYAYFPAINRLAIDTDGRVRVYDSTGHSIQGFGQQQGGDASLTFTSQRGTVRIDSLPRAYTMERTATMERAAKEAPEPSAAKPAGADAGSVLTLIEQLAALKEKGILTGQEFTAKKAEPLKRL